MKWQEIITIVAALGGPTAIVSVFMLLPQIRKLQADTDKVERDSDLAEVEGISRTALAQMDAAVRRAERAEAHAEKLDLQYLMLRERVDQLEQAQREYRRVAQEHVAWDVNRVRDLVNLGVTELEIPTPPPLLPPPEKR